VTRTTPTELELRIANPALFAAADDIAEALLFASPEEVAA
jgi:hypothetical protein